MTSLVDDFPIHVKGPKKCCVVYHRYISLYIPVLLRLQNINPIFWCCKNDNFYAKILKKYINSLSKDEYMLLLLLQAWLLRRVYDYDLQDKVNIRNICNLSEDNTYLGKILYRYVRETESKDVISQLKKKQILSYSYIKLLLMPVYNISSIHFPICGLDEFQTRESIP